MTGRLAGCLVVLLLAQHASAASEKVSMTIRGQTQALAFYPPSTGLLAKGTILMGSGDVGWVGLAVNLAGFLAAQGYAVIGINSRQYLASYTSRGRHVLPAEGHG